jgi:hypothetical protein
MRRSGVELHTRADRWLACAHRGRTLRTGVMPDGASAMRRYTRASQERLTDSAVLRN